MEAALTILSLLVLGWAVVSDRLARWNITGPLVFTLTGFMVGNPLWGTVHIDVEAASVHVFAEFTLALLLFSDASKVNIAALRRDLAVPARLLGIGLPVTVALGSIAAFVLFPDVTWALALFIGATLAPTDAALSEQVITDTRLPSRVRRTVNVESGLNDGIVTPIVVFALAVAASQTGSSGSEPHGGGALVQLALGVLIGGVLGLAGARLIGAGSRSRWMLPAARGLGTLATAFGSFSLAQLIGGNGFLAAFMAGIAFGAAYPRDVGDLSTDGVLTAQLGEVLALGMWFLFGAALLPVAIAYASPVTLLYAILSLSVLRMLPVALALVGTGLDRGTVLFIGWFGPRGLASVVFALLAIDELDASDAAGQAISVVALTILLSIVAHGISARPLGRRYALHHAGKAPGGP